MFLKGKTAVVTGVSKGIGNAVLLQLLESGVKVAGWGLNDPKIDSENFRFFNCDVSKENEVQQAFDQTIKWTSDIDILINNAGFGFFHPITDYPVSEFTKMWEVNVLGTFLVARIISPHLIKKGTGHIVNISSIAGKVGSPQGEGYNASKFAVAGLSECLFQELRTEGIKVTTVFPGAVKTHFFDEIPGVEPNDFMLDPKEVASSILHLLNTSPNFLIREIEVRPLNSKPPKPRK